MHGLVVDAYAASHGGDGGERRDRQSVAIHLAGMHAVLDRGYTPEQRIALLQRLTTPKRDFPLLERPAGVPGLTWQHLLGADDVDEYGTRAHEWARAVRAFWTPARPLIEALL